VRREATPRAGVRIVGWLATLKRWRRERVLRRVTLDETLWLRVVTKHAYTRALPEDDLRRLRDLVKLFLHDKPVHGAGEMAVTDEIRVAIATQACILILELGLEYYRGWSEVIVYPGEFVARYDYTDEDGVVHQVAEPMAGEAWHGGPVILSWADASEAGGGTPYNVVMHEFAHKLDMLNGDANGFPPLHANMRRETWAAVFTAAYRDFCDRIDAGEELPIDEYASESPAEFFAVLSEVFFEHPALLIERYPEVYRELTLFYRQDPAARLAAARAESASSHAMTRS
jgi:MtfA peptidase